MWPIYHVCGKCCGVHIGFVVTRVLSKISCVQCMSVVTVDDLDDPASSLMERKNRGGLMLP